MSQKRILIVDDEESILTVLKGSLKKLGPDYQVVTVTDGFAALDNLLTEHFDLVVTDYNMAQMDGLELLEAIRYAQPDTKVIIITAYGNEMVESETRRLKAYRYLTKPLDVNAFRQIVQEALDDNLPRHPGILILSDDQFRRINRLLEQLRNNVSARCVFLTNTEGRTIAWTGETGQLPMEQIASLLGGGIATLLEIGRTLDDDPDVINLAYREGRQEYLYALNVGPQMLLIMVIKRGLYSTRLGSAWYYAQQTAVALRQALTQSGQTGPRHIFNGQVDEAFNQELDKLLTPPPKTGH